MRDILVLCSQLSSSSGVSSKANHYKPASLTSFDSIVYSRKHREQSKQHYFMILLNCAHLVSIRVWDPEGKEYIDMLSAYSAVNQVSRTRTNSCDLVITHLVCCSHRVIATHESSRRSRNRRIKSHSPLEHSTRHISVHMPRS